MARCALGLRAPRPGLEAGVECVFRSGMMHEFCAAKMGVTGAPSDHLPLHADIRTARRHGPRRRPRTARGTVWLDFVPSL